MSDTSHIIPQEKLFNPYAPTVQSGPTMTLMKEGSHPASYAFEALPPSQESDPKNVMEVLVTMEIVHQLQQLPKKQQEFIKVAQVKAYALNSLPSLYVTSESGWEKQWQRGQTELRSPIRQAVRQGFAAVQRDPLRGTSPLPYESIPIAETVLAQMRRLLGKEDLTWYTVLPTLKQALGQKNYQKPVARALTR